MSEDLHKKIRKLKKLSYGSASIIEFQMRQLSISTLIFPNRNHTGSTFQLSLQSLSLFSIFTFTHLQSSISDLHASTSSSYSTFFNLHQLLQPSLSFSAISCRSSSEDFSEIHIPSSSIICNNICIFIITASPATSYNNDFIRVFFNFRRHLYNNSQQYHNTSRKREVKQQERYKRVRIPETSRKDIRISHRCNSVEGAADSSMVGNTFQSFPLAYNVAMLFF
ncbi:unnamed protein product [Vicia faba]|uniref:Uncharacterized protein n=1 Tax=Vicia faba TaxID=3906 RepID=A0AAV0YFB6_VICFA|nr:unnamed protein product [Vicia faba]